MISRFLLAIAWAIALTACNPIENLEYSETKITQYENAYSNGNVDALWRLSGDELRKVTVREEFDDLVTVFTARLGKITSSERTSFNVKTNNGVTQTVIVMDTQFEQGEGVQTYTFFGHGADMQLVRWHVDSPQLAVTLDDLKAAENASD